MPVAAWCQMSISSSHTNAVQGCRHQHFPSAETRLVPPACADTSNLPQHLPRQHWEKWRRHREKHRQGPFPQRFQFISFYLRFDPGGRDSFTSCVLLDSLHTSKERSYRSENRSNDKAKSKDSQNVTEKLHLLPGSPLADEGCCSFLL